MITLKRSQKRVRLWCGLLGLLFTFQIISACSRQLQPIDWDQFTANFIEEYFELNPTEAVWAGRHEFDGQLPDLSPEGITANIELLNSSRETILGSDPRPLTDDQRFERNYLMYVLDRELFWLRDTDWQRKNALTFGGRLSPDIYLSREYAPLEHRMAAYTTYATNLPQALDQLRGYLRPPLSQPSVETAINVYGGLVTLFDEMVPQIFASVQDSGLQQAFQQANQQAVTAAREMVAWLEDQLSTAENNYAMGADLYSEMLEKTQWVNPNLDSLKAVGEEDLARNLTALREASEAYMPGEPVADVIASIQSQKPEEGPVARAQLQLTELKAFLEEQDLVTIPGDEIALVDEAPPHRRWNRAYISIPGPYEENLPSVYYIAPPDPTWSEDEQQAYIPPENYLLFTSIHEVWPGHFLQFLHGQRVDSEIGQLFGNYAFGEGWAHYTEELMWEAGYGNGDPAIHIGQLLNALLRDVRFLASIGLHTEGMRVEEAEQMFRESAFQDPGNARQQAARGTFDPGYLNYTMGKLLIRELREHWTESRGGRQAWKAFHDEFLSYGAPPISLVWGWMMREEE